MKPELERVVVTELDVLGFDLVDLRAGGSRNRPVLDVRIDRRDGEKVQVGDCERASRAIEARLDALPGLIDGRYVLEVSSPGMERPLRTAADWRRSAGKRVHLQSPRLAAIGGHLEGDIVAVTGADGNEQVVVRDGKGIEHALGLAEVTVARLAFHWKP